MYSKGYRAFKSLDSCLSNLTQNEYAVACVNRETESEMCFRFLAFRDFGIFKQFRADNPKVRFHEIIKTKDDSLGRLVFDIDLTEKLYGDKFVHPEFNTHFENLVKTVVNKCYRGDNSKLVFIWMTSSHEKKYSRHLIVKNALLSSFHLDLADFYRLLLDEMKNNTDFQYVPPKYLKYSDSFVDTHISTGTFLRMMGTTKNNVALTLDDPQYSLEDTLVRPLGVMYLADEQSITLNDVGRQILNRILTSKPQHAVTEDPNQLAENQAVWILDKLSSERAENTRKWISVGACVKQLCDTQLVYNKWVEWSRRPIKYQQTTDKTYSGWWQHFEARQWTSLVLLNWLRIDAHELFQEFLEDNPDTVYAWKYVPRESEPPRHYRVKVDRYDAKKINPFDANKPVEVIRSKMDTEKTRSLIQFIKEHPKSQWIIYPTSRFSTAKDVQSVFKETGRNVIFYTDINVNKLEMFDPNSIVVIQLESLPKLSRSDKYLFFKQCDLLILDECTSCCKQLSSITMRGRFGRVINMFEYLVKRSKKIIAMDADIDDRVFRMLLNCRSDDIYLQWNDAKCVDRTAYIVDDKEYLIKYMFDRMYSGENVFVVCSTKSTAHKLERLVKRANFTVRCHTSDECPADRDVLHNVNDLWIQYRCVIITSTITNGVNFHTEHFDSMFVFAENGETACVRDIKQMMGRVRKLRSSYLFCNLRNKNYRCPTSYKVIREGIINRTVSYMNALESIPQNEYTIEMKIRMDAERIDDLPEGPRFVPNEDWLSHIHILNFQENNKSKRYFRDEFIHMLAEQGIPVHMTPTGLEEIDKEEIKEAIDTVNNEMKDDERQIYEETPVISDKEANEIRERIEQRRSSKDDHEKYEVYSVVRYFKVKPSKEHFDHFKYNKRKFVNILAETQATPEEIVVVDRRTLSHRHMINGRLDQYLIIKELCKRLNIENTITPFTFDTRVLQDKDEPKKLNEDWQDFLRRARHAFNYGCGNERMTVQSGFNSLRKILKEWSDVNFGRGKRKDRLVDSNRYQSREYTTSISNKTKDILPQLKTWHETCRFSLLTENLSPETKPIEGSTF